MTTHHRWPPFFGLSFCSLLICLLFSQLPAYALVVSVIENNDPRISYLPSVCNNTGATPSASCTAPWQVTVFPGASSGTLTSTFGPTSAGANFIPQLFLVLRGISLVLNTSAASNATANVSVVASPSNIFVSSIFKSSEGSISVVNLPSNQDVTLAVTYIPSPDDEPTRLDIDSVTVTSENDGHTSLTSIPLPSSSSLPSFIIPAPTSTHTGRPHSSLAQPKGTIIGESLAGFFGLILIVLSLYALLKWRRRRRLRAAEDIELRRRDKGKGRETGH